MPKVSKRGTAVMVTLTEREADRLASIGFEIIHDPNIDFSTDAYDLLAKISEGIDELNG